MNILIISGKAGSVSHSWFYAE